ncbi:hypothetical protein KZ461_06425, partial [Glaesserella parasuis]|nr:hypothetical protein [Glaesserella parasuis]
DKTLEAFPEIRKQFSQLYLNIEETAKRFDQHLLERINNIENNNKNIISRNQQINDDFLDVTAKIKESLNEINQSLVSRISNIQTDFDTSVKEMQKGFNKAIERVTNEQITQFKVVTEILSQENKKFVNELIEQTHSNKGLLKGLFGGKK